MELQEVEAVLERIWDLHDKLSHAIHAISRSHFLSALRRPADPAVARPDIKPGKADSADGEERLGYVFVKEFRLEDDAAVAEAKGLNAIRSALENLEDQLEFVHTMHSQQQAERDAALARLEQSRILLLMRLAEYHGKKYKVLDEAMAFVGQVQDASRFVTPETLFEMTNGNGDESQIPKIKRSNAVVQLFASTFSFVKKSLRLDQAGSFISHTALVAAGMVALLQLHGVVCNGNCIALKNTRHRSEGSSSSNHAEQLDVLAARG